MQVQRKQLAHFGRSLVPARPLEAAFRARRSMKRGTVAKGRHHREGPLGQISMISAITTATSSLAKTSSRTPHLGMTLRQVTGAQATCKPFLYNGNSLAKGRQDKARH